MNVELLESVRLTIARTPDRFCAAQWAFARNAERVLREGVPPEGFRCCIAGHVLLRKGVLTERGLLREGGFHTGGGVWSRAAEAASISGDQGRDLFFPSQWDRPYKQQYYLCDHSEEASLAAEYLDYFLQKHGHPAGQRPSVPPRLDPRVNRDARAPAERAASGGAGSSARERTARIAA